MTEHPTSDAVASILAQWRRERPDLDVAPMGLIGRLGRLSHHLSRAMEQVFATHDLTAAGFDVLATLRRSGAPYRLSPGALLRTMMITSGTLTHRLDLLDKAGLIRREPNPEDQRSVAIVLTNEGLARIDAAVNDHVALQAQLVARLTPAQREALDALLANWLAGFERE